MQRYKFVTKGTNFVRLFLKYDTFFKRYGNYEFLFIKMTVAFLKSFLGHFGLKERQLSAFGINASAGLVVIVLVQFEADEVPLFFDARHRRRSAAHAVVENRVAFVGIGADEVSQQVHRLLGGVKGISISCETQY